MTREGHIESRQVTCTVISRVRSARDCLRDSDLESHRLVTCLISRRGSPSCPYFLIRLVPIAFYDVGDAPTCRKDGTH